MSSSTTNHYNDLGASSEQIKSWPLLTDDLPGTAGHLQGVDDFIVEEIPAYLPCGIGEHCLARVQKRGLTTPQAVERICRRLNLEIGASGYAGLKDKQGVTTQWMSFAGARPEDLLGVQDEDLRVLEAARHGNKIRTGHLHGNHFIITLHEVNPQAAEVAQQISARLLATGLPNFFGEQRFGRDGDNAAAGLSFVRKEKPLPRDRFKRRLFLSALQSQMFNEVLAARLRDGKLQELEGGEVLQRTDSGGLFVSEEREVDQHRLSAGELVITGPICGPRMPLPKENSPARSREEEVFSRYQLTPQSFADLGKLARGGRRPLTVPVAALRVEALSDQTLRLNFSLPAGSYATVLLREIAKQEVRI